MAGQLSGARPQPQATRRRPGVEHRGPGKTEQLLALLSTGLMVWFMLPEHQRRLVLMRAAERARSLADRLARREGYAGMGAELAGRDPDARYGGALLVSRLRDWLAGLPERWRP